MCPFFHQISDFGILDESCTDDGVLFASEGTLGPSSEPVLALQYVKGRPRKEKSLHVLFVYLALHP